MIFRWRKKTQRKNETEVHKNTILGALGIERWQVPESHEEVESYPLYPPFSYCMIVRNKSTSENLYIIDELPMNIQERRVYQKLRNLLERDLKAPKEGQSLREAFTEQVPIFIENKKKDYNELGLVELNKILYYLERDIAGYGLIEPLMFDTNIEDISCTGFRKPLFLWHRKYENIRTTIEFEEEELNDFVIKMVHKAGKHVSLAFPIVDATLPEKHRLAVTYGKEVTPSGTSFTIRKFRTDPLTIIDLIKMETLTELSAAYLWFLMENNYSLMIVGATGAGKTTALNAIACLTYPNYKILTVEEVAEINLPHENWVSTISRPGFGMEESGQITLYELIKSAVRHRPDLIVVGEIRGEEAYVLFQSLATGHGGLCTMHADSVEIALKRLTQPPMNIPQSILSLMNCIIVIKHVKTPMFLEGNKRISSRRFIHIAEIMPKGSIRDVSRWVPTSDIFTEDFQDSYLLGQLALRLDLSPDSLFEEMIRRRDVLRWMANKNIRDYKNVNEVLNLYYNKPKMLLNKVT